MNILRKIYDWMGTKVQSPYAIFWLAGLFFIEAFCFIIPVDPLLILFCIENQSKSFYYATIATISSVFGGLFGYAIGFFLWDSVGENLVRFVITQEIFESIREKYLLYQNWAVFIAGFTPIPYKAVTLSAGFCKLPVIPFTIFSILARGGRFFLIAGIISLFGPKIKIFIDRYFNQLVILFTILIVLFIWILK